MRYVCGGSLWDGGVLSVSPSIEAGLVFRSLSVGCRCVSGFTFIHSFTSSLRPPQATAVDATTLANALELETALDEPVIAEPEGPA